MSGAAYWLQRQRKGDLHNLAEYVGMKDYTDVLKPELEVRLDDYLRANQTTWSKDPQLSGFYRRMVNSPIKREGQTGSTAVVLAPGKQRRQTIKAREDLEQLSETDTPSSTMQALQPRTPSSSLVFASNLPLPTSPAVLADKIEAQTTSFTTSLSGMISRSPLPGALHTIRASLSSATSIHLLTLFIEACGLFSTVVPLKYLTTLPAVPALGITWETSLKIPDLFALLSTAFWGPVGLWIATSIALPLIGGWAMNLRHDGGCDGVSYGVVRGLLAWIVYAKGGVSGESRGVVEGSVPGGSVGMMVGAAVGVLGAVYEVILRK
ncbi:MAG: hypothetical protein Q9190_006096 [Brigantiaea leucoxantha]